MDPFLPAEIQMMVLRYLAALKCERSVMAMIEELPMLKAYIQPKPDKFSNAEYVKYLARSSMIPGLKDVLFDYGNSKILAEEILDSESSILPGTSSDSLQSKLKTIQEVMKVPPDTSQPQHGSLESPSSQKVFQNDQVLQIVKTDQSTSTEEPYECPSCAAQRLNKKVFTESSCQTEEFTAVQFGLQDEIPLVFYKTLLNDNNLQQKIAQTINEHIHDPLDGQPESVVRKVASKTETEIDKFLVEFLKDIPVTDDDGDSLPSDILPLGSEFPPITNENNDFAEVERNMSLMFGEPAVIGTAGSGQAQNNKVSDSLSTPENTCSFTQGQLRPSGGNEKNLNLSNVSEGSLAPEPPPPHTPSTPLSVPLNDECNSRSRDEAKKPKDDSSPSSNADSSATPSRSRKAPIKRIKPTPVPPRSSINPVFKTSVIEEKQTVDFGDKCSTVTKITKEIDRPAWDKLNRKSIAPKIPGLASSTPNQNEKVRVIKKDVQDVITFRRSGDNKSEKAKPGETKKAANPTRTPAEITSSAMPVPTTTTFTPAKSKDSAVKPPQSSQKKRKATPVKLTPEKAKNLDYNFMHVYHENSEKAKKPSPASAANVCASDSLKTDEILPASDSSVDPVQSESSSPGSDEPSARPPPPAHSTALATDEASNSQSVVTPMQANLAADLGISDLKTISPSALRRLITSAGKLGGSSNSIANFINKKKSYSTPRKRKHVRSLTFATPPSMKEKTLGLPHGQTFDSVTSRKRKATEDSYAKEFKSKKRLDWPESAKKEKKSSGKDKVDVPKDPVNVASASTTEVEKPQALVEGRGKKIEETVTEKLKSMRRLEPKPLPSNAEPPLPTIPEESMNATVNEEERKQGRGLEVQPSQVIVPSAGAPQTPVQNQISLSAGDETKITIVAVPVKMPDGTEILQYYQFFDQLGSLVPVTVTPSPAREEPPTSVSGISCVAQQNVPASISTVSTSTSNVDATASVSTMAQSAPVVSNVAVTGPAVSNVAETAPAVSSLTESVSTLKTSEAAAASNSNVPESAPASNSNVPETAPASNSIISSAAPVHISEASQQSQYHTSFSIVPAPIGFPEPTPIKNFAETGFLNISDIGFNSPLITPFKIMPPSSGMNETQFTLPPTPRVIDDHDSNSNSTHSMKLTFDGMIPMNLLTSTPMKYGLPKTPGRCSSNSSNSRSPPVSQAAQLKQSQALVKPQQTQIPPVSGSGQESNAPAIKAQAMVNLQTQATVNLQTQVPPLSQPAQSLNAPDVQTEGKPQQSQAAPPHQSPTKQPASKPKQTKAVHPKRSRAKQTPKKTKTQPTQAVHPQEPATDQLPTVPPVPPVSSKTNQSTTATPIQSHTNAKPRKSKAATVPQSVEPPIVPEVKSQTELKAQKQKTQGVHPQQPQTEQPAVQPQPSLTIVPASRSKPKRKRSPSPVKVKSEGEVTTSDEEEETKVPSRSMVPSKPQIYNCRMMTKLTPPADKSSIKIISNTIQPPPPQVKEKEPRKQKSPKGKPRERPKGKSPKAKLKLPPLPPPSKPQPQPPPQISFTISPNNKQKAGITFHVGGKGRALTFSEKEVLFSLVDLSSGVIPSKPIHPKRDNPNRPVGTASVISQQANAAVKANPSVEVNPSVGANSVAVIEKRPPEKPAEPHTLLKHYNIKNLIGLIRRKAQTKQGLSNLTPD